MNKRERIERTLAGEMPDRLPVSIGRHFPGDDQRAADLARSLKDYQQRYDWDFLPVYPSAQFSVTGYGLHDQWHGQPDGQRTIVRRVIQRSLDWTELRTLDPMRGDMGKQLECLRLLTDGLEANTPILHAIYSPLAQAARLVDEGVLIRHMRTEPDRLRTGLNVITESTLRFIDSMRRLPMAGIIYIIEHAHYNALSEAEYQSFGAPYDRKILESIPQHWWLNLGQVHGDEPMLNITGSYPLQALSWADTRRISISDGRTFYRGAVSGGLDASTHINLGTPASIRDAVREALHQTSGRRFILSSSQPVPVTAPVSNLRTVREVVESAVI
jgi:uroporphyrinogen decarboxylase